MLVEPKTIEQLREEAAETAIKNLDKYLPIIRASKDASDLPTLRMIKDWIKEDGDKINAMAAYYYKAIDKAETIGGCLKAFERMSNYRKHKEVANTILDMCQLQIWHLENKNIIDRYWKGEN